MKKIHGPSVPKNIRSLNFALGALGILSSIFAITASAQTSVAHFTLSPPTQYGVTATFVDQTSIQALLPPEQAEVLEGMIATFMQESLSLSQNGATIGPSLRFALSPFGVSDLRGIIGGSRNLRLVSQNGCTIILQGVYATVSGRSATQDNPNVLLLEAQFSVGRISPDTNCAAALDSLAMFVPNTGANFFGISEISTARAEQLSQLTLSIPIGLTLQ